MENILQNTWFVLAIVIIGGFIIGLLLIKPLLNLLIRRTKIHKFCNLTKLFRHLRPISIIFGITLLFNFVNFYPSDINLKEHFALPIRVMNAISLTIFVGELLIFTYEKYSQFKDYPKVSSIFHIIIRLIAYSIGLLMISSILEYDLKAMLTALGVGGLAIALALQDTLSNLFAGMQILASKQLKPGDYIRIREEVEGYVLDINWRNTTIRTLKENVIIVPNITISSTVTTNFFTIQSNFYFQLFVGVHYDSDLNLVEEVTLDVAKEVLSHYPSVPKDFTPKIRFVDFSESSIKLKIWLATDVYEKQFMIKHHFIKALHKRYKEEGIIIPYPIRTIYKAE